jgi:hypothetical protein
MNTKRARDIYKHAHMERELLSTKEVTSTNTLGVEVSHTVKRHQRVPKENAPGFRAWARGQYTTEASGKLARIVSKS